MTFDLSAALEALQGRMQTSPSEFFEDTYRWNFITHEGFKEVLTEDELRLLAEGLVYVRRAEINSRILQALLGEPQPEYEKVRYPHNTTAVNIGMQTQINQMEITRQQNQQQYGSALGQNTPSQYLKSFFK